MATLAALLKSRGHDVSGSDQNVYPPMSDFLAREGITTFSGYAAEHITPDIDLVVVGNAISRGNPELEAVLERKIRYCSLPEAIRDHFLWGARSIVIAGTHGKTTTTSLTGWLLTHGGSIRRCSSAASRSTSAQHGSSYRVGDGPRLRHRGRRVRQRVLRQDGEVPEVPARHRGHQQHRVRSRRHLRRPRCGAAGVPAARRIWCRGTGCCCSAPTARTRTRLRRLAVSPVETFGLGGRRDWQARRHRASRRPDAASPCVAAGRSCSADSSRRCSVCTTCATRWPRSRVGAHRRAVAVGARRGPASVQGRQAAARDGRRCATASRCSTTSRTIRPRCTRRWPRCDRATRAGASGRSSSRGRRRRAGACSRTTSRGRSAQADRGDARGRVPIDAAGGRAARRDAARRRSSGARQAGPPHPGHRRHRRTIVARARAGDVVVLMSNGGFGGIHGKLLQRVE